MREDWDDLWIRYAASAERNPAQTFRRLLVLRALGLKEGARLLDLGSGQGDLAGDISRLHPNLPLLGLDISPSGLAESAKKVPHGTFIQADLMKPLELSPQWKGWATHAVCSELLEHVDEPERVLANALPLLAPEARLVVTVPAGPRSAFDKHIGHLRHYDVKSLTGMLERAGFQVEEIWRAGFPFFNLYRLVVVLRGKRLIRDAASDQALPWTARSVMTVFRFLFRFNAVRVGPGWQMVALARPRKP